MLLTPAMLVRIFPRLLFFIVVGNGIGKKREGARRAEFLVLKFSLIP
jgi:hypothetical protein